MENNKIIEALKQLQRYDMEMSDPGCSCCSPSITHSKHQLGDWIKVEDIEALINQLEATLSFDDLVNGKYYSTTYPNQGKYIFQFDSKKFLRIDGKNTYHSSNTNCDFDPDNGFHEFKVATEEEIRQFNNPL